MSSSRTARFPRSRYLPLAASGTFADGEFEPFNPETRHVDGHSIVPILGPLVRRPNEVFDSYPAICDRIEGAVLKTPRSVILEVDSPGGELAGLLGAASSIADLAASQPVPIYTWVDGECLSGAYVLASATNAIFASSTSCLGGWGVLEHLTSLTGANEMAGLNYAVVTSGKRKADGNPNVDISDGALEAAQERVNAMAAALFDYCEKRRGPASAAVREGAVFVGADAVSEKLADKVTTFTEVLRQEPQKARTPPAQKKQRRVRPVPDIAATVAALNVEISAMQKSQTFRKQEEMPVKKSKSQARADISRLTLTPEQVKANARVLGVDSEPWLARLKGEATVVSDGVRCTFCPPTSAALLRSLRFQETHGRRLL